MKKEISNGSIFEIELEPTVGGYGYVRVVFNDVLHDKPKGFFNFGVKKIQLLKLYREEKLKRIDDIDWQNVDLLFVPHHLFGDVPTRGKDKWKLIGVLEFNGDWDYVPHVNKSIVLHSLPSSVEEGEHTVQLDDLGLSESFKQVNYKQAIHLPHDMSMYRSIVQEVLTYFWMLYLEGEFDMSENTGIYWYLARYYYIIFNKVDAMYRGKILPSDKSIYDFIPNFDEVIVDLDDAIQNIKVV